MTKESKYWATLRDRGRNTTMIQFFDAVADCLLELKERVDKIEGRLGRRKP